MVQVTSDDLDRVEFRAVHSGEHGHAARELERLAEQADAHSTVSRAELLARSGEQWEMAYEFARAAAVYQRAVEDGGPTLIDARALRAGALLELERWEEARQELDCLLAYGPRGLQTYLHVAEALYAYDDLPGAEHWSSLGVVRFREQVDTERVRGLWVELLRVRFRVRVDLGRTEDDLDRLLDEV
ncbi:hypothetical protein RIF23_14495 [Lipingzhangella sp. LS1_29]|uniref:Tetratricopeptide repeat protein n=1 Tax=Lipingzhangella rawalii TaxID=2055835 RepID=A0ABU2H9J7_9ACTN|nr:hypothetical protein [Lipingzhangella rawalii]MDS1271505.1 hypothetical protein [Lipingzhangella rawalii]